MASSSFASLKPYAIPLVAVMVVGICLPLVVMPGYNDIQVKLADIGAYTTVKDSLQQKLNTLQSMDNEANKKLLADSLELAIPASEDAAGLLAQLERIAQEVGATSQSARFAQAADPTAKAAVSPVATDAVAIPKTAPAATEMISQEITVTLAVSGTFAQVYNFVDKAENSLRLNNITQLNIVKDQSDDGRVLAQFDITAPYVPNLTDLGVVSTLLPEVQVSASNPVIERIKKYSVDSFTVPDPSSVRGRNNPF